MPTTKEKWFRFTKFTPEVVLQATQAMSPLEPEKIKVRSRQVQVDGETWSFDNDAEFFALYRTDRVVQAAYWVEIDSANTNFRLYFQSGTTHITIGQPTRAEVEHVFNVFESAASACRLPEEKREQQLQSSPRIFIGHGHSPLWRDLKDHLGDKHNFRVRGYETGARAGLHIADILEDAQDESDFAILVLTGENADSNGILHARENVIHEMGLFQGKLGFNRAIVLLEDGCAEFSNLAGVQHIPFAKGSIKETFGEVLATIRREFLDDEDAT